MKDPPIQLNVPHGGDDASKIEKRAVVRQATSNNVESVEILEEQFEVFSKSRQVVEMGPHESSSCGAGDTGLVGHQKTESGPSKIEKQSGLEKGVRVPKEVSQIGPEEINHIHVGLMELGVVIGPGRIENSGPGDAEALATKDIVQPFFLDHVASDSRNKEDKGNTYPSNKKSDPPSYPKLDTCTQMQPSLPDPKI